MSDTGNAGERKWAHHHGKSWAEWSIGAKIAVVCAGAVAILGFVALCGAVVMWLWNALMPAIFKLPEIGFWQAIGLTLLSQILFKGGAGHAGRSHWKKRQVWKRMREDEAEPKPGQA